MLGGDALACWGHAYGRDRDQLKHEGASSCSWCLCAVQVPLDVPGMHSIPDIGDGRLVDWGTSGMSPVADCIAVLPVHSEKGRRQHRVKNRKAERKTM